MFIAIGAPSAADGVNAGDVATGNPLPVDLRTDNIGLTTRLGEVQASPTANTVLDRLKALLTGIVLAAGANRIGKATIRNSADSADIDPLAEGTFTGRIGEVQASPTANTVLDRLKQLLTGVILAAGTNIVGYVGLAPRTSGGLSSSRTIAAATTNATSVKASAGQVYGWYISNINAAVRYLKLYDKASAPAVGTDTPKMTIAIPGNTAGAGAVVEFTNGIDFATGIAFALTTGVADADTAAVAANEIVINLLYK